MSLDLQYYCDLPGRDLSICDPDSVCWVDIEPGCFQDAQQVRDEGTRITEAGLRYGTYCGRYTLLPEFEGGELSPWPLWYADYRPPDFQTFQEFGGWLLPDLWQYWSDGYLGVNCDLSITPDGRLFADISNYTTLTQKQADYFKHTLDGVVIGLQSAAKAREFKAMLSD